MKYGGLVVWRLISFALLLSTASTAFAQDEEIVLPVPNALGTISASYFDEAYLKEEGVQHLGVDLPAPEGSLVVAPVAGTVILNRTDVSDPFDAYLIIRSSKTGFEHVLAHLKSDIEVPLTVNAGDTIGTIVKAGSGPHLHYGINQLSVSAAIDVAAGWGFGRGPANATFLDAGLRGWLAPNEVILERMLSTDRSDSEALGWWAPGLVLSGEGEQNNGSSWSIRITVESNELATISYDSIPCSGKLFVTSNVKEKIIAEEVITKNKSNCVDGGIVEVERKKDGDFSYSWTKGGELATGLLRKLSPDELAFERAADEDISNANETMVEITPVEIGSISSDPCDSAEWDGVVRNVADLFLCDESRAIELLTSGASLAFPIEEVRLEDGWLFLETFTAGSFMDSELEAVRDGEVESMEQFLNATSSYEMNWRIVCFRKPSAQNSYGVGDIFEGRGKITQYEAKTVVLDCR